MKNKIYFGWIIVALSAILLFFMYGTANSTISLYMIPVTTELSIGRTAFSTIITFRFIFTSIVHFFYGPINKKLGCRRLIFIGCFLISSAVFLLSISSYYPLMLVAGTILGIGFSLTSTATISTLLNDWFNSHKGLVQGIVFAAMGMGGSVMSIFVEQWISNCGWRTSFKISAAGILALGIITALLVRNKPEEKGLIKYGEKVETKKTKEKDLVPFSYAMKKPSTYILLLTICLAAILNNPVYTLTPSYLQDIGFDGDFAARVMSVMFFSLAICKIITGALKDKFGMRITVTFTMIANAVGIFILNMYRSEYVIYFYAAIFGLSLTIETMLTPFVMRYMFGEDNITFVGIGLALCSLGSALGNPIINATYDAFGSYEPALKVLLVLSLLCGVSYFFLLSKPLTREIPVKQ